MAHRNMFRAFHLTGAGVGAGAEAQFVHFGDHGLGTAGTLDLTLREQGERADARCDEQHGGTVLAGCCASAASYAGSRVHALVRIFLRNGNRVRIGNTARVDADEAACLQDLVVSTTVDHQVFDYREAAAAPGLDGDGAAILEFAHIELAGGYAAFRAVCTAVDIERAGAADTFAAVVVERHGAALFAVTTCIEGDRVDLLADQLLVEDVHHLQERSAFRDVLHLIGLKVSFAFRVSLTPDF